MDTSKCITDNTWLAFSKGQLSASQLEQLNAHAANCLICADIKEGIEAMKTPANLELHVQSVQQKLVKKQQRKRAKIISIFSAIAVAAVLLAVGNGFLLMMQEDALVTPVLTQTQTPVPDSPMVSVLSNKDLVLESPARKKKPIVKRFEPTVLPEPIQVEADDAGGAAMAEDVSNVTETPVPPVAESESSAKSLQEEETYTLTTKAQAEEVKQKEQTVTTAKAQRTSKLPAPVLNNNQNASMANMNNADNAIKPKEQIKSARKYFEEKDYRNCLAYAAGLATDSTSEYHYEAMWLMAQSYVALENPKQARLYLNRLGSTQNPFTQKALALLATLPEDK